MMELVKTNIRSQSKTLYRALAILLFSILLSLSLWRFSESERKAGRMQSSLFKGMTLQQAEERFSDRDQCIYQINCQNRWISVSREMFQMTFDPDLPDASSGARIRFIYQAFGSAPATLHVAFNRQGKISTFDQN